MKFTVTFPLEEIRKKLRNCKARIAKEHHDLNEAVGVQLLSLAQQDYRTKSRGGTGTDGIKWAALKRPRANAKRGKRNEKRKTTKGGKVRPTTASTSIGIDTGLQQASASPGFKGSDGKGGNILEVTDTSVTVGFGREYSEHFDALRPLLPIELPESWRQKCEDIKDRRISQILKEELE